LIKQISKDLSLYVAYPNFKGSKNTGLENYYNGFVKEGVGAGGAILMALLKNKSIEEISSKIIETVENI
ncbi:MAG: TIGR00303 family protein, partial [Methanobrevibacter sp.]|nr:TIGR00303 family protein [Methanobrevibacter sp.]